jgi:hypothetical protein
MEAYTSCCSIAATARKVVAGLQQIVRNIAARPLTYLGDFKAGVDARYDIDVGEYILAGRRLRLVRWRPQAIRAAVGALVRDGLLTAAEASAITALVPDVPPSYARHKALVDAVRQYTVVRWTAKEILAGTKTLRGGLHLALADAVTMKTVVKIDVYVCINARFIEFTNWFLIKTRQVRDGHSHRQTITASMGSYDYNIKRDIAIYKLPELKRRMKLAKRLWLYAAKKKDEHTMRALFALFNSSTAKLSQIVGDLETLCNVLDKVAKPPMKAIHLAIEDIKMRMSTVLANVLPSKVAAGAFRALDVAAGSAPSAMRDKLQEIQETLAVCVDRAAYRYLSKAGLI